MMRSTPARVNIDDVSGGFQRRALMDAAADPGIFAFRILAHDHPVELTAVDVAQRRGDAGQHPCGAHIGVLVERLADRKPQAPQRDVVGDIRVAGGAEQDGIVLPDQVAAVLRHHAAVLLVVLAAPVEMIDREAEDPSRLASACSASTPAEITSVPMPSPGMAAIL